MPIIFCSILKKKEYHEEIKNHHQGSIVPWHFHGFGHGSRNHRGAYYGPGFFHFTRKNCPFCANFRCLKHYNKKRFTLHLFGPFADYLLYVQRGVL